MVPWKSSSLPLLPEPRKGWLKALLPGELVERFTEVTQLCRSPLCLPGLVLKWLVTMYFGDRSCRMEKERTL